MLPRLLNQVARDDQLLHFGCPFVDAQRANIAIQALDHLAARDAAAAEHLHRTIDDLLRGLGGRHLRHGNLSRRPLAAVAQPRRTIGEKPRRIDIGRHVGERRLGELEIRECLAEQGPMRRMRQRLIQRALRESDGRAGHRGAEDIERPHRELESLALGAEPLTQRHAAITESKSRERMRRDDVSMRREIDSPGVAASTTKALIPSAGDGAVGAHVRAASACEHAVEVRNAAVRDPCLLTVQTVAIRRAGGAAAEGGNIGARVGLREREGCDGLAGDDARKITRLAAPASRRLRWRRCRGPAWRTRNQPARRAGPGSRGSTPGSARRTGCRSPPALRCLLRGRSIASSPPARGRARAAGTHHRRIRGPPLPRRVQSALRCPVAQTGSASSRWLLAEEWPVEEAAR